MNIIKALEQFEAMLPDMEPMFLAYKEELKKQGFTENQAYQIARDCQKVILSNVKGEIK